MLPCARAPLPALTSFDPAPVISESVPRRPGPQTGAVRYHERVIRRTVFIALLPAVALAASARHFDVTADFVPAPRAGAPASVVVTFHALDRDLQVNETPAPRLKLDLTQTVLVDKQPSSTSLVPDYDPRTARYLDMAKPVVFPVAIAPTAPRGEQLVKASVVYFYCSTREAWCRRGTVDVLIPVTVR